MVPKLGFVDLKIGKVNSCLFKWVFPKIGVPGYPKMDGENNGKPF